MSRDIWERYECDFHYRVPDSEVLNPEAEYPIHANCGEQLSRYPHDGMGWVVPVSQTNPLSGSYYAKRTPERDAIEWGIIHLARWASRWYRFDSEVKYTCSRGRFFVFYEDSRPGRLVYLDPVHVAINEGLMALARWAQQWKTWPRTVHGAEGKLDEWYYPSAVVHRAARHPETSRYGSWATPTSLIATACQVEWKARPLRAFRKSQVTCETCLETFEANPKETPSWQPAPTL